MICHFSDYSKGNARLGSRTSFKKEKFMFAITGATGQVGQTLVRHLRAAGRPVRLISRRPGVVASPDQAFEADICDAEALTRAFDGAEAAFILLPPSFDPADGFPEARAAIDAVVHALRRARPQRVVALSTIGAQTGRFNLLNQLGLMEQALSELAQDDSTQSDPGMSLTFLRPSWFMENTRWDIAPARDTGIMRSFLQPLDTGFPMVSVADVGAVAAELMLENFAGRRVVELTGPARVSPHDIAAALTRALSRSVVAEAVPRTTWRDTFLIDGMQHPDARVAMLDGFNEGWIAFEGAPRLGVTTLDAALSALTQETGGEDD
jgi:uncharacterized protein YbjT (DUF2867 family)